MRPTSTDTTRYTTTARLVAASAVSILAVSPALGQFSIQKIALTRDSAPETGLVFDQFFSPVLNSQGEVSFNATVTGPGVTIDNEDTIYTGFSENTLSLVARQQADLPGFGAGVSPSLIGTPRTNASGQMVFAGSLTGPGVTGADDRIAFLRTGGSLQSLSRAGDPAPVADPDAVFAGTADASYNYSFLNINDAGKVAFTTTFSGVGIDFSNSRAVVSGPINSPSVVARTGDEAPGAGVGTRFGSFISSDLVLNEAGEVAFMAPLTGPSVVDENSQALYADTFGGLSLVARTGTAATALGFGVSYDQIVEHDLSDTGQTLFSARLRGLPVDDTNDSGIFLRGDGPAELVIREGDPAPGLGPGVVFGGLVPGNIPTPALDINDSGKIAFRTMLRGDGVDNSTNGAIYATNDQGDLDLILRDGDQVPGLADGVVFSQSDLGGGIVLNDRGDLLILAQFEGPGIVEENDAAIFYLGADSGYDPQIVVRQGDLLDVDNSPLAEDLRVVEFFDLSLEQFRSSFSDHGQITFQASFTDSSQGVFLATVPEPSAAILAVLLAIGCATTARRLGL